MAELREITFDPASVTRYKHGDAGPSKFISAVRIVRTMALGTLRAAKEAVDGGRIRTFFEDGQAQRVVDALNEAGIPATLEPLPQSEPEVNLPYCSMLPKIDDFIKDIVSRAPPGTQLMIDYPVMTQKGVQFMVSVIPANSDTIRVMDADLVCALRSAGQLVEDTFAQRIAEEAKVM